MIDFITSVDFTVLNFIQDTFRCAFLDVIMAFFSIIGEGGIVWFAITVPMLFNRKTRSWGVIAILSMALAFLCGELIIKNIVCRERPFEQIDSPVLPLLSASGFSFPSSHSASSFASATVIFKMNKKAGAATLALACLIALSRLYNYVHFPSDVLCGALLGVLSALLLCFLFKKFGWKDKIDSLQTARKQNENS